MITPLAPGVSHSSRCGGSTALTRTSPSQFPSLVAELNSSHTSGGDLISLRSNSKIDIAGRLSGPARKFLLRACSYKETMQFADILGPDG
jgi:hypothetical protein